ncbi:hypothetical protein CYMTET_42561, partial [Cymbomonas tetramitiformis]
MNYLGSFFGEDAPPQDDSGKSSDNPGDITADAEESEEESEEEEAVGDDLEEMVHFFYEALQEAGKTNKELNTKVSNFLNKDTAKGELLKLKQRAARSDIAAQPTEPEVAATAELKVSAEEMENKMLRMRYLIKEENAAVKQLEKDMPREALELRQRVEALRGTISEAESATAPQLTAQAATSVEESTTLPAANSTP